MTDSCGVSFLGDLSTRDTVALARRAEELGVDAVWMSETYFERDAWTTLAAIAAATDRVKIGTGVVPVFMRHPALLAMSFATLDELSGGRVVAGVGTGVGNVVSDQLAYDYRRPLTAMREALTIMRGLLSGEFVEFEGRVFSARGVRLAGVPLGRYIPIHAAAVGPRMCQLAGELADGVHYAMRPPSLTASAQGQVDAGAVRAGRDPHEVDRVTWCIAAVHDDAQVARDLAREHIVVALSTAIGESQLVEDGFDPGRAHDLRTALARGGVTAAMPLVSEEMVDHFAVAGTPSQVIEQVERLIDEGITQPVLTAYGPHAVNVLPVAAQFSQTDR